MKKLLSLLFALNGLSPVWAQVIEGYNDCHYAKEVFLPFGRHHKLNGLLHQNLVYNNHEQFSFWYKLVVTENEKIRFRVAAISDSDEYEVYVYKYNKKDFCDKAYFNLVKPVKLSFYGNDAAKNNPYQPTERSFMAKKDNIYYISVLNVSLSNCGHLFYLISGADTLHISASHSPCKRDFMYLPVKGKSVYEKEKKNNLPLLSPEMSKPGSNPAILTCKITDAKNHTPIDAQPLITEENSGLKINPIQGAESEWTYPLEKGKKYKISVQAFGYVGRQAEIPLSETQTVLELALEPYKEGDHFIMESIYFFPNTYAIKNNSAAQLEELVRYMAGHQNVCIEIQGHSNGNHHIPKNKAFKNKGEEWDFEGSAKKLSQKRAESIKQYLEDKGIKPERIRAKGYGGKKPVIKKPKNNEEGKLNSRVELIILKA